MREKLQNIIGGILLVVIIVIIITIWLSLGKDNSNSDDNRIILTPSEVNADPAAYTGDEIRVEGVVITKNQGDYTFLMMPIDIYIQCGRNAFCGEEYSHLKVRYQDNTLPSFEHNIVVTGNLNKNTDNTYVLYATKIKDKGKI
jgi:hypothetical protein